MERQSTSKLYRALIAVVAFFVLCTSAILFASCGTDPRECKHEHLDDSDVLAYELATCNTPGTVTYECSDCGAAVTVIGTLATGEHTWANGKCTICGVAEGSQGLSLKEVKDALATLTTKVDGQASVFLDALKDSNFTIPALEKKLEAILEDVIDLDVSVDASEFPFTGKSGKVSLVDVVTSLYTQVHQLYLDYASKVGNNKVGEIYDLLVGTDKGTTDAKHVHNWILKHVDAHTSCTETQSYVWGCAFCDETKEGNFTVQAVGHATDFKYATTLSEADRVGHYYAATCISGARVEGHCANCDEWTGEWTTIGEPTYKHNYVLEATHGEGSCTAVHSNVYHCTTCGGAYVEEDGPNGHQYYYKMVDGEKVALTEDEKRSIIKDYWNVSSDNDVNTLTEEQKGLALQAYLNVVYSAEATCVDPALVVVECVECGVRYSYTLQGDAGAPTGHNFVAGAQIDNTCTTDGVAGYAYCVKCGYFFFTEGLEKGFTKPGEEGTWSEAVKTDPVTHPIADAVGGFYTRNYIRTKDGKIIHYDLPADTVKPNKFLPAAAPASAGTTEEPIPKALTDLYDVVTEALAAPGHSYVPVYINKATCVTSARYILVCENCYEVKTGTKLGALTTSDTTGVNIIKDANGKYFLNGLTDDPNHNDDLAFNATTGLVAVIGKAAKKDDPATTSDKKQLATSDLTAEWNALNGAEETTDVERFAWLAAHGYLVRDAGDNGPIPSITRAEVVDGDDAWYDAKGELTAEAKTLIEGYLAALGDDFDVTTLRTPCNVLGTWTDSTAQGAQAGDGSCAPARYQDVVVGHQFDDYFVTVVGGCTLYERHVYFCSVCGQEAGNPAATEQGGEVTVDNTQPHLINGSKTDDVVAGYKADKSDIPDNYKGTDLKQSFEAALATKDPIVVELWLMKYGYFNDYRTTLTNDWSKVDPMKGMMGLMEVDDEDYTLQDELMTAEQRYLGGGGASPFDAEDEALTERLNTLAELFTEENVLDEYTVKTKLGQYVAQDTPITLGHHFDTVVIANGGETCDAPATYVYVCSACGLTEGTTTTAFGFWSGTEQVKFVSGTGNNATTNVKVAAEADVTYKADQTVFEKSVPLSRRTAASASVAADFPKSDLALEWDAAVTAGTTFKWMLEHGYLNGVVDSMMLFGYDVGTTHTKGALEEKIETADKTKAGWLQTLFDEVYAEFYETNEDGARTVKVDAEEVKKAATAIAGANADLNEFYTKSGNSVTALVGKAANKTSDVGKTTIPESGHVWLKEDGSVFDPANDPLCLDFASEKLKGFLNPDGTTPESHHYAEWDETTKTWTQGEAIPAALWKSNDPVFQQFLQNVKDYGVLAACNRNTRCPLEKEGAEFTAEYALGFYAATAHKTSYEKYSASSLGYPTGEVETAKVYYNYNPLSFYNDEKHAADYLASGTWSTADADAKKAAAQKAMDADLENLGTLQKYWNTLFVDKDWLKGTEISSSVSDAEKKQVVDARKANYPTIELAADYLNEDGSVNYTALKELFDAAGIPALWKTDRVGDTVSAWRPLSDVKVEAAEQGTTRWAASCWVSLRCKWYKYNGGTKCNSGYPDVNHVYPTDQDDNVLVVGGTKYEVWFGRTEHFANCQHKDLCMCCGQPIGNRIGSHRLVDVTTLTGAHAREAWIKILENAKDATSSSNAFLQAVKGAVWFAADVDFSDFDWQNDWGVLNACYDAKNFKIEVCTGELEIIYANLHSQEEEKPAWNENVDWTATSETTNPNWKVTQLSNSTDPAAAKHGWAATDGVEGTDYKTRFFYLTDFYAKGEIVGAKDTEIFVDAQGTPVAKGTDGAKVATEEQIKFSGIACDAGYYAQKFCLHEVKHPTTSTTVTDGKCWAASDKEPHAALGHAFAAVEGYKTMKDANGGLFYSKEEGKNAILPQVCTNCGLHAVGEWGANKIDGVEGESFRIANETEIKAWNDFAKKWNAAHTDKDPLWLATLPAADDIETSSTVKDNDLSTANGILVFKSDVAALNLNADTTKNMISEGKDVTILVGGGSSSAHSLKLTPNASDTAKTLTVKGTLSIIGEVDAQGKYLSEIDFSALSSVRVDGGHLVLENIKVKMSDTSSCVINPGPGLTGAKGGAIDITNAYIESNGTVFGMNANSTDGSNVITIKKSVLVSKGSDFGLAIWKKNVKVEAFDSTFAGKWGGALIRSGSAEFTNCNFVVEANGGDAGSWGNGSNVGGYGALVVGNNTVDTVRGNATVTLTNCDFGTYTSSFELKDGTEGNDYGSCSNSALAINAFCSTANKTTVTLDSATAKNAGNNVQWAEGVVHKTVLDSADDATAVKAAVNSVTTNGGELVLPEKGTVALTDTVTVASSKDVTIDLNGGKLTGVKDITVQGNLTVKGGTVEGKPTTSKELFAVTGSLDLESVTVTVSGPATTPVEGVWPSTYGIYAGGSGKVTVANSVISNAYGPAISTNGSAAANNAEVLLTDSAFISNVNENGKDCSTSVALLLNNGTSKLYAGGCYFYGVNAAAWVRSGEAHFYGCTFASPVTARSFNDADFSTGAHFKSEVAGVLIVGNGKDAAYGAADVQIVDCDVKAANTTGTLPTAPAPKAAEAVATVSLVDQTAAGKLEEDYGTDYNKNWHNTHVGTAVTGKQVMTLVATGARAEDTNYTAVAFSDEATAREFVPGLKLTFGTNVFKYNDADRTNFMVGYEVTDSDPVVLTIDETIAAADITTKAAGAIEDAAANGGKIEIAAAATAEAGKVTLNDTVSVGEGKSLEVVLGNNVELDLAKDKIISASGSTVKISGGKIKSSVQTPAKDTKGLVEVSGKSNVEISDTELVTDGGYAIGLDSTATESVLKLTNVKVTAQVGFTVNGNVTEADITLTNSTFLADNAIGCYLAGNATITATGCVFYGSVTAAEVVSGNVTFDGCTFASGADKTGWAAPSRTTSFVGGASGFPGAYAGHITVVEKEDYQRPLTLTLKGETKWVSIDTDNGDRYTVEQVFKAESDETNDTPLNDVQGNLIGYYQAAERSYEHVTIAIVDAGYETAETPIVTLTTEGEKNKLDLVINTNVWVFTSDEVSTKVEAPELTNVQKVLTVAGTAGTTLSAAAAD